MHLAHSSFLTEVYSRLLGPQTQPLYQHWAHHRPEISFHASRPSNFETDNNYLGPGLDCMAGDLMRCCFQKLSLV